MVSLVTLELKVILEPKDTRVIQVSKDLPVITGFQGFTGAQGFTGFSEIHGLYRFRDLPVFRVNLEKELILIKIQIYL